MNPLLVGIVTGLIGALLAIFVSPIAGFVWMVTLFLIAGYLLWRNSWVHRVRVRWIHERADPPVSYSEMLYKYFWRWTSNPEDWR